MVPSRSKKNHGLKELIVQEDPELASRLFDIFHDREIARLYIEKYEEDPKYSATAWFVAKSVWPKRTKRYAKPDQPGAEADYPENPEDSCLHFCGNPHPAGNFWAMNEWDNIVRASEEVYSTD